MSFLGPLSEEVWGYILLSFLIVSIAVYVIARFTPYEWVNTDMFNPDQVILSNQFSLSNSVWFVTSTLMQQGKTKIIVINYCYYISNEKQTKFESQVAS